MKTNRDPDHALAREETASNAIAGSLAKPRSDSVQSLVRALSIINKLAGADDGLALTKLAQSVGLAPSTAHRLLTTLEQERYVQFDVEERTWSIGVQTFIAGSAFLRARNLVAVARPYMRALMEECRETVNLAIEDNDEAMYLSQVESRQMMRAQAKQGARVPLYCSSVGKALLSAVSERELAKVLRRRPIRPLTAKTIASKSALRNELALTRERGFAVDDEEHAVGLRCVAALIFNELGESIAAISISGPTARISKANIPRLGDQVRRKADEITAQLGGIKPRWRKDDAKSDAETASADPRRGKGTP